MEDLLKFLPEQLLILVAALYVLGVFLKNSPKVSDWIIPWVLLIVGIIGAVALQYLQQGFTPVAVFQGVVATGVAVLTNQLIKQTVNKD
jgi:hypothetical protein